MLMRILSFLHFSYWYVCAMVLPTPLAFYVLMVIWLVLASHPFHISSFCAMLCVKALHGWALGNGFFVIPFNGIVLLFILLGTNRKELISFPLVDCYWIIITLLLCFRMLIFWLSYSLCIFMSNHPTRTHNIFPGKSHVKRLIYWNPRIYYH